MASSDSKKRNFDDYIDGISREYSEANGGAQGSTSARGAEGWGHPRPDADSGRATNRQRIGAGRPAESNPYSNRVSQCESSSSNSRVLGLPPRPPSPSPQPYSAYPRTDSTPASGSASSPPIDLAYPSTSPHAPPPRATAFQLPAQVTSFSYDNTHTQLFDNSSLRYYNEGKEPIGASLSEGFERWVRKPSDSGRIDATGTEGEVEERVAGNPTLKDVGVVAWRGIMTK